MRSSNGRASPVRIVRLARAWLDHGDLLVMVNARTSFFTVRISVRNRNGLTLRFVGSGDMLLPVPFLGQGWCVVCQRSAGFIRLCYGVGGDERVWGILGVLEDSAKMGGDCSCVQGSGYAGVPIAGNALSAEVGGGIIFVVLWKFSGFFIRFMHLMVCYGYQGADSDAEHLALTAQLFDDALGELGLLLEDSLA